MHIIRPGRESLHGRWDGSLPAALEVEPGAVVRFEDTLDVSWGMGQHVRGELTRPRWGPRESPRDDGMALHGPVAVRGAQPGDVLAVELLEVTPMDWGWTWSGESGFNRDLNRRVGIEEDEEAALLLWSLDADAGTATDEHGRVVPLRPFPGTIGLCPPGSEPHVSWYPTRYGGNMDCREIVAGTTLYLPVGVPGGMLSLGDGHARQGDGELGGTAIECRMKAIELRLDLVPDGLLPRPLATPVVRTREGWVCVGVGRDLDDAVGMAVSGVVDLIVHMSERALTRREALTIASTDVDVRITQLVNDVRGVHAVWRCGRA